MRPRAGPGAVLRAVVAYVVATVVLVAFAVPGVGWLVVLAEEVAQENGRARGAGSAGLGWDFVLLSSAPPVLGMAAALALAAWLLRRARVPARRVVLAAVVVAVAAATPALWIAIEEGTSAVELTPALSRAAVGAGVVAVLGMAVAAVAASRAPAHPAPAPEAAAPAAVPPSAP